MLSRRGLFGVFAGAAAVAPAAAKALGDAVQANIELRTIPSMLGEVDGLDALSANLGGIPCGVIRATNGMCFDLGNGTLTMPGFNSDVPNLRLTIDEDGLVSGYVEYPGEVDCAGCA